MIDRSDIDTLKMEARDCRRFAQEMPEGTERFYLEMMAVRHDAQSAGLEASANAGGAMRHAATRAGLMAARGLAVISR